MTRSDADARIDRERHMCRDPLDMLGAAPDDARDHDELLELARSLGFSDEIRALLMDEEHRRPNRSAALQHLAGMDRDQRMMFVMLRTQATLRQMQREQRHSDRALRDLRRAHDDVMSGDSKSGCRHLTNAEHALDRRILIIETKAALYAGAVSIVISPIVAAIISVLMGYLTRR